MKDNVITNFVKNQLPKRIMGNCCVLLCGEINGVKYTKATKEVQDVFDLRETIPQETGIILNPIHDVMIRFEMKLKKCFLSDNGRWVVSVWNEGKISKNGRLLDRKGTPWTVFHNGKEINIDPIPNDIDVSIGILDIGAWDAAHRCPIEPEMQTYTRKARSKVEIRNPMYIKMKDGNSIEAGHQKKYGQREILYGKRRQYVAQLQWSPWFPMDRDHLDNAPKKGGIFRVRHKGDSDIIIICSAAGVQGIRTGIANRVSFPNNYLSPAEKDITNHVGKLEFSCAIAQEAERPIDMKIDALNEYIERNGHPPVGNRSLPKDCK